MLMKHMAGTDSNVIEDIKKDLRMISFQLIRYYMKSI